MTRFGHFVFQLVRAIAGSERTEWFDAMATEARFTGNPSGWAIGCLFASLKDRIAREGLFILAVLTFPILAYLLNLALFFPLSWLWLQKLIPGWVTIGAALLAPLPFAIWLGRMRPGRPAYLASLISFPIAVFFPLALFWMEFGKSPFSWFGADSSWYMMTPLAGLSCALLVWFGGVWIGTGWRRRSS